MWLLLVEALFAFFLLVFIVWWTMYAGRKPDRAPPAKRPPAQHDGSDRAAPGDKLK